MTDSLRQLLLSIVPNDGSAVGNLTLATAMRESVPDLSDEAYQRIRDGLIADGMLGKGRGRGGSVFLIGSEAEEDEIDADNDAFSLTAQEPSAPAAAPKAAGKKKVVRKSDGPVQVLSYRHAETRVNNPEVGMVHPDNDPDQPKTVWKYDPHLDPELMFDSQRGAVEKLIDDALASEDADAMRDALVELKRLQEPYLSWAGKAEGTSFAVDTVSLHVHERVDPATILANARKRLKGEKAGEAWRQADLFAAAFENLPLRQALDFYHHEKGWSNRLIAGDSLLVMNSLLLKESMARKEQTIYIDPPYGIKYGSNFQPFVNKKPNAGQDKDEDLTSEPEMIRAFRDTWALGEHSYLTYLSNRIKLSYELLAESGSIFIQISQTNEHRVRLLLDEVFGAKNYVETIAYRTKNMTLGGELLEGVFDYIIWYAKNKKKIKFNRLYERSDVEGDSHWNYYNIDGSILQMSGDQVRSHKLLPEGADPVQLSALYPTGVFETGLYDYPFQGVNYSPPAGRCWKSPRSGMDRLAKAGRIVPYDSGKTIRYALRLSDYPISPLHNIWADTAPASNKSYVVQTAHKVIERCVLMTSDPGDLVFDPTCGSGTTAYVAEKWGRRWITCDTSRVALNLARQRLLTASFEYYSLRYPDEGLRGGFSYQSENHITLKSITNNPDVDEIYGTKHPAVATALNNLNSVLTENNTSSFTPSQGFRKGKAISFSAGDRLEEWEVPLACPDSWPAAAATAFADFHSTRRNMQSEMDRSISSHAEQETLYDKPLVDKSRLRITGPFSVEAVPAPTVLSLDESAPPEEADVTVARSGETSRQTQWRDELVRTGIRAKGGAMLKFTDLEAIPGVNLDDLLSFSSMTIEEGRQAATALIEVIDHVDSKHLAGLRRLCR